MRSTDEPRVNLPGLGELRSAVENAARALPTGATLRRDGAAGLTVAVASVPDGMAGGVLAGVNPVYGLYANILGPVVGGIFSGTVLMVVSNTSAVSLVAGQSIEGLPREGRDGALFLMVILSGALQVLFGFLRLGRLTRFVSYTVMTGFLAGIAVILILSQLPVVTGIEAEGENRVTQALALVSSLDGVSVRTLAVAALAVIVAIVLPRTRLRKFASLLAIALPTLLLAMVSWDGVQVVGDVGEMPRGMPMPVIPPFETLFDVFTGAISVALIGLVQGAGVSQSVPNPDGTRGSASRDFVAQGAANIAAGFFRGLPVGGSLSSTALNVVSGARRRWAAIFAGIWMAVIVVGFPGVVSRVAMPALGALLILAGITSIKPSEVVAVWRVGWSARLVAIVTFLATLVLPIQGAVAVGVVLSGLLYVNRASTDVTLVELIEHGDGRVEERRAPGRLQGNRVTVLDVYGHLFFAGARTLERQLPRPEKAENPAVVLRLRGRTELGATLVDVLSKYADELRQVNGRLYLAGIGRQADEHLIETGKFRRSGPLRVYDATPIVGQSTGRAHEDADDWLESVHPEPSAS
jgi:SulP family sulfate permease